MAKRVQKIHYNNALYPDLYVLPLCEMKERKHALILATTDVEEVTCQRCLKFLERKGRIFPQSASQATALQTIDAR